jgi:hypothetical protein
MGIEEAIQEFRTLWQTVYVDANLDPKSRSMKLEDVFKDLLRRRGVLENQILSSADSGCKAYAVKFHMAADTHAS